jgi:hypothetical protein
MAQILQTIEEYISEDRQKDTIFITFNEPYAKARLGILLNEDESEFMGFLDKEKTNWGKRDEFIQWMKNNYPDIGLEDVFDNVPLGYLEWPFLGTIATDVEIDSPEYHAINKRYEDENGEPKALDAVVWIMAYDVAKELHAKKEKMWEDELGE